MKWISSKTWFSFRSCDFRTRLLSFWNEHFCTLNSSTSFDQESLFVSVPRGKRPLTRIVFVAREPSRSLDFLPSLSPITFERFWKWSHSVTVALAEWWWWAISIIRCSYIIIIIPLSRCRPLRLRRHLHLITIIISSVRLCRVQLVAVTLVVVWLLLTSISITWSTPKTRVGSSWRCAVSSSAPSAPAPTQNVNSPIHQQTSRSRMAVSSPATTASR